MKAIVGYVAAVVGSIAYLVFLLVALVPILAAMAIVRVRRKEKSAYSRLDLVIRV